MKISLEDYLKCHEKLSIKLLYLIDLFLCNSCNYLCFMILYLHEREGK